MQGLNAALDRRAAPLTLFFRDDDAGWDGPRLDALLDVFATQACPIDLAVIPAALTESSADALNAWRSRHPGIGLHQHGYAHLNYEPESARKCEFGASRPVERQCADIMMGRERLSALLGDVDPIFTPPWNRCLPETIARLPNMGFKAVSNSGKSKSDEQTLQYLPIHLDWEKERRSGAQLAALETLLAQADGHAGIMLHHATMSPAAVEEVSGVIETLRAHPNVYCAPMRALLEFPS
jgi:peptidoglycan/xylan/chitin deacetylase (PgdA/CDA1 family)